MLQGIIEVRSKNQVTLPKDLATKLHLCAGDILEYTVEDGKIIITPKILISKDQAWFWTKAWQEEEKSTEEEKNNNGCGKAYTAEALAEEILANA